MDKPATPKSTTKYLCSYGGKILPRYPDGKLRYRGGHTRVLAIDRSVSFSELLVKLGELCGCAVSLRCQMPTEDLDALVSITSDEDLANLMEEYDRVDSPPPSLKIRAFLSPPKPRRRISNDSSLPLSRSSSLSSLRSSSSSSSSSLSSRCSATAGRSRFGSGSRKTMVPPSVNRRFHQVSPPMACLIGMEKYSGRNIPLPPQHAERYHGHVYASPRNFTVRMRQIRNNRSKSNLGCNNKQSRMSTNSEEEIKQLDLKLHKCKASKCSCTSEPF